MKRYAVFGAALLTIALAGCKSTQEKLMDAQMKYNAAVSMYIADCPNLDSKGNPDVMFGKPNRTPKCVEEDKHAQELNKKVQDLQKELAK